MTGWYRGRCCCSGDGSCDSVPENCPDTVTFSVTHPEIPLELIESTAGTVTDNSPAIPSTNTQGVVTCANDSAGTASCLGVQLRCESSCNKFGIGGCDPTAPSCDKQNYTLTRIPIIRKRCSTSGCETGGGTAFSYVWDLGIDDGLTYGTGTSTINFGGRGGTITYEPIVSSLFWLPQVTSITTVSATQWEYGLKFWCIGSFSECGANTGTGSNCGDLIGTCGTVNGSYSSCANQIIGSESYAISTGEFVIRKEDGHCLSASWTGSAGKGQGVVSITPPSSGGALLGHQFAIKCTGATSPQTCTDNGTCTDPAIGSTYFRPTSAYTATHGSGFSWSIG
jgi:hypothetical protein